MPRNQRGDCKDSRKRGCARCGNERFSSGAWCFCNGFRADGLCFTRGQERTRGHATMQKKMRNGTTWSVSACMGLHNGKNEENRWCLPIADDSPFDFMACNCQEEVDDVGARVCWCACVACGCQDHVDEVGDRVCWCLCEVTFDWESAWKPTWKDISNHKGLKNKRRDCCACGCTKPVDEVGDRVCWCNECDCEEIFDWEAAWKPTWRDIEDCKGLHDCCACGYTEHRNKAGDQVSRCLKCEETFNWGLADNMTWKL